MVGGACDVAAWVDLLGGNHHPTVDCPPGVGVDGAQSILNCHDSRVAFAAAAVDVLQNNHSGLSM
jgi:hypothetical protein